MKKFAAPLTLALACIAYGLAVVCEFYFAAQAQGATNVCNIDCLLQKMDALNQKSQALEHTVGDLALQINQSIKTGQTNIERVTGWFNNLARRQLASLAYVFHRNRPCPLYPQKRTCAAHSRMSALGQ